MHEIVVNVTRTYIESLLRHPHAGAAKVMHELTYIVATTTGKPAFRTG